jgi:hypothetical protein
MTLGILIREELLEGFEEEGFKCKPMENLGLLST